MVPNDVSFSGTRTMDTNPKQQVIKIGCLNAETVLVERETNKKIRSIGQHVELQTINGKRRALLAASTGRDLQLMKSSIVGVKREDIDKGRIGVDTVQHTFYFISPNKVILLRMLSWMSGKSGKDTDVGICDDCTTGARAGSVHVPYTTTDSKDCTGEKVHGTQIPKSKYNPSMGSLKPNQTPKPFLSSANQQPRLIKILTGDEKIQPVKIPTLNPNLKLNSAHINHEPDSNPLLANRQPLHTKDLPLNQQLHPNHSSANEKIPQSNDTPIRQEHYNGTKDNDKTRSSNQISQDNILGEPITEVPLKRAGLGVGSGQPDRKRGRTEEESDDPTTIKRSGSSLGNQSPILKQAKTEISVDLDSGNINLNMESPEALNKCRQDLLMRKKKLQELKEKRKKLINVQAAPQQSAPINESHNNEKKANKTTTSLGSALPSRPSTGERPPKASPPTSPAQDKFTSTEGSPASAHTTTHKDTTKATPPPRLSISVLKQQLDSLGVNYSMCVERRDLVELLRQHLKNKPNPSNARSPRPPTGPAGAGQGPASTTSTPPTGSGLRTTSTSSGSAGTPSKRIFKDSSNIPHPVRARQNAHSHPKTTPAPQYGTNPIAQSQVNPTQPKLRQKKLREQQKELLKKQQEELRRQRQLEEAEQQRRLHEQQKEQQQQQQQREKLRLKQQQERQRQKELQHQQHNLRWNQDQEKYLQQQRAQYLHTGDGQSLPWTQDPYFYSPLPVARQEKKWEAFAAWYGTATRISHSDIPWPYNNIAGILSTDTESEKHKKFRKAMLRWHPDKFFSAFASKCSKGDSDYINDTVTRMTAQLLEQRATLLSNS